MPYRRTPTIQARLDGQRADILQAAAELLLEQGYAGCTVAAVAARAGVAAGTVYTHFASKSTLDVEVFRSLVEREVDAVRAVAAAGPAGDRLDAVVTTFAGRALRNPRRAYALLAEPVDAPVEATRLEFRRAFRDVIAAAIDHGVLRGDLPPQPTDTVAAALVGAIGEALVGPLATGAAGPATVTALVAFVHRAVGLPESDRSRRPGGHVRAHA